MFNGKHKNVMVLGFEIIGSILELQLLHDTNRFMDVYLGMNIRDNGYACKKRWTNFSFIIQCSDCYIHSVIAGQF